MKEYLNLRPPYRRLLKLKRSKLRLLKMYVLCQKFHTQVVQVYLQLFRRTSLLKCASQSEITKNFTKTSLLRIQGHLKSLMLTLLKSSSLVLVMISRISVLICNCFHARRANISKITTF